MRWTYIGDEERGVGREKWDELLRICQQAGFCSLGGFLRVAT